ncbi:ester cyclase [Bacterioplanes sanyensis]|nr:ester cyclase [Bacterioplanes sanyensis]
MDEQLEGNKRLVRQFIELTWNQGRHRLAASLVSPQFSYQASMIESPMGLSGMGSLIDSIRDVMDDFAVLVDDLLAEGDQVVSQSTFTGSLRRPFMGFEPTDRIIALNAVTFWQVRRGSIQSAQSLLDSADLMHQAARISHVANF